MSGSSGRLDGVTEPFVPTNVDATHLTLVDWLRAQIDEDERIAEVATGGGPWRMEGMSIRGYTRMNQTDVLVVRHTWPQEAEHIVRHDPARVLREVEAKRRILDWVEGELADDAEQVMPWEIACALALPYADRAGYRDEWRPE